MYLRLDLVFICWLKVRVFVYVLLMLTFYFHFAKELIMYCTVSIYVILSIELMSFFLGGDVTGY
jgi:hypothetical protein